MTNSGYVTSTNRCLFPPFSKRFRSKPACSMALVCRALISSQSLARDWYLSMRLRKTDLSPSLGTNW
jgi:hypothetical protein